MATLDLLDRFAEADTRYRRALERLLVWQNPDQSRTAGDLFLEGWTEQARDRLPPELYSIFKDAADANAELRHLEAEIRRFDQDRITAE